MQFSPETIEDVRRHIDLVSLAKGCTALRRQGQRWLGCCPFHREKTPSFSVDAQKGVFYCFGCQAGGDGFAFVMKLHNLSFGQAVRHLANAYGISIDGDSPAEQKAFAARAGIRRTLERLQGEFRRALNAPEGAAARAYLTSRQVDPRIARQYGVGFGCERQALAERLARADVRREQLEAAGLAGAGGAPLLCGRITFPILDVAGQLTSFGGRALDADAAQAKYMNGRDSELFSKQRELFGLGQAASSIRQSGTVLLCEGYFDVLAAAQAGHGNAVAALGTALTPTHAATLAQLAKHVVLVFDGDRAGIRAARKAATLLKAHDLRLEIASLPAGEDPASLLCRRGKAGLREALEARRGALDVFVERAFSPAAAAELGIDLASIEGKVAAAGDVAPLVLGIGSSLERELYVARVAERVGVTPERLLRDWHERARARRGREGPRPAAAGSRGASREAAPVVSETGSFAVARPLSPDTPARPEPAPLPAPPADWVGPWTRAEAARIAQAELDMLRELLLFPSAHDQLEPLAEYLVTDQFRQFVEALSAPLASDSAAARQTRFDSAITQCVITPALAHRLRAVQPMFPERLDEGHVRANRTVEDILRRLKRRQVDWTLRRVLGELREAEAREDATDALLRRKQILTARKRALSPNETKRPTTRARRR